MLPKGSQVLYVSTIPFYASRMTAPFTELQQRFSIANVVRFEAGQGGLTRIVVTSPLASAEVYLHGAHVTHFQPMGQKPVLWMSGQSLYQTDKAIRGGVPICFPWFGPKAGEPSAPMHGFARLREWQVESVSQSDEGAVEITFTLTADEQTRTLWPAEFVARYCVHIGKTLKLTLQVQNKGDAAFTFEEALHTYFAVGEVRQVSVTGLEATNYLDKTDGSKEKSQGGDAVVIVSETDRVYLNTTAPCVLNDPANGRRVGINKAGSQSTVVWNPWIAKSKAMVDFGDEEWNGMICIETCNLGKDRVELNPGAIHEMRAEIRIV